MERIGLGGGCHWCTEAVFQTLVGVTMVEQGFVASNGEESHFAEAIIVHYDSEIIGLKDLIEIHLHTHRSSSNHSMRNKYRSAIYVFDEENKQQSELILESLKNSFEAPLITKVLQFEKFKSSEPRFHSYYSNDPNKPFCETYISPKLSFLRKKFSKHTKKENASNSCGLA